MDVLLNQLVALSKTEHGIRLPKVVFVDKVINVLVDLSSLLPLLYLFLHFRGAQSHNSFFELVVTFFLEMFE